MVVQQAPEEGRSGCLLRGCSRRRLIFYSEIISNFQKVIKIICRVHIYLLPNVNIVSPEEIYINGKLTFPHVNNIHYSMEVSPTSFFWSKMHRTSHCI